MHKGRLFKDLELRSTYKIMKEIKQEFLKGERALFKEKDLIVKDSVFDEGESPLKESRNIELEGCMFRWKYPLWYCHDIKAYDCKWFDMARAGVWYSDDVKVVKAVIDAPKNFRKCRRLYIEDAVFPKAQETLWSCSEVEMKNITVNGDYFAMNCSNMKIDGMTLTGNYSFDGVKNCEIRNARMLSKDAFWNSENITVYDSFISGEYLGWNAKNLTLVDCTIESLQGMCYIENLKMVNCRLINTTLAFEYSTVDAQITSHIDSVKNPLGGVIRAKSIGELIMEKDMVDVSKTQIICEE